MICLVRFVVRFLVTFFVMIDPAAVNELAKIVTIFNMQAYSPIIILFFITIFLIKVLDFCKAF